MRAATNPCDPRTYLEKNCSTGETLVELAGSEPATSALIRTVPRVPKMVCSSAQVMMARTIRTLKTFRANFNRWRLGCHNISINPSAF